MSYTSLQNEVADNFQIKDSNIFYLSNKIILKFLTFCNPCHFEMRIPVPTKYYWLKCYKMIPLHGHVCGWSNTTKFCFYDLEMSLIYQPCDILMSSHIKLQSNKLNGVMAELLTRQTRNVIITSRRGSSPTGTSHCFLEQRSLLSLLSTGWS
jgi:hypothetical protein